MRRLVFCLFLLSSSTAFVVSSARRRESFYSTKSQQQLGVSTTTKPTSGGVEAETARGSSSHDLLTSLQQQSSTSRSPSHHRRRRHAVTAAACEHDASLLEKKTHKNHHQRHHDTLWQKHLHRRPLQPTAAPTAMTRIQQPLLHAPTAIAYTSIPSITSSDGNDDAATQLALWQGRVIVLAAAAIFGTNFATVKLLDQVVPTSVSMALRFVLAAVAISGSVAWQQQQQSQQRQVRAKHQHQQQQQLQLAVMQGHYQQPDNVDKTIALAATEDDWIPAAWMGVEIGCWYMIGYLCQSYGLHYVAASKSAFFNSIAVIVVPLLDVMFKGKRLGAKGLASVGTALAGVGLLQFGPALLASTSPATGVLESSLFAVSQGDLLCLLQAIFFGIGYWRLERASRLYPDQAGPITAAQLVALGIGATAFCVAAGDVPEVSVLMQWLSDPFILKALMWTGLVSTAFALYLETVALRIVSASELTVLMTSVSLWGSAFAFVTMGEILPPIGLAGGLLILGGCVMTARNDGEKEEDGSANMDLL